MFRELSLFVMFPRFINRDLCKCCCSLSYGQLWFCQCHTITFHGVLIGRNSCRHLDNCSHMIAYWTAFKTCYVTESLTYYCSPNAPQAVSLLSSCTSATVKPLLFISPKIRILPTVQNDHNSMWAVLLNAKQCIRLTILQVKTQLLLIQVTLK